MCVAAATLADSATLAEAGIQAGSKVLLLAASPAEVAAVEAAQARPTAPAPRVSAAQEVWRGAASRNGLLPCRHCARRAWPVRSVRPRAAKGHQDNPTIVLVSQFEAAPPRNAWFFFPRHTAAPPDRTRWGAMKSSPKGALPKYN